MASKWTALRVTVPVELADAVGSFLLDCGAPGLETEESDGMARVSAYFAGPAPFSDLESYCGALAGETPGAPAPRIEVETLPDQAWAESWKDHFPPLHVGERLFVHPPWVREVPVGRIGIVIDPGTAFGTGHHASTRGCLKLIETYVPRVRDPLVLDVGTGSGILAIAAEKLGARGVIAIDIDTEACRVARANAAANRASRIDVRDSMEGVGQSFEVIVANLLALPLIDLSAPLFERLAPGGVLIGSGLLAEEASAVCEAWEAAGLAALERYDEDGWVTLAYTRRKP